MLHVLPGALVACWRGVILACSVAFGSMLNFIAESRRNLSSAAVESQNSAPASAESSVFEGALRAAAGHASIDVGILRDSLRDGGFSQLSDVRGISGGDLAELVPAFASAGSIFVDRFLKQCQCRTKGDSGAVAQGRSAETSSKAASSSAAAPETPSARAPGAVPLVGECDDRRGRAALVVLGEARRSCTAPAPPVLTAALVAAARCSCFPGGEPCDAPREEAKRRRIEAHGAQHLHLRTLWVEFTSWRRSAAQYASAVRLWGEAAAVLKEPCWPPSEAVLDVFVGLFRNGNTLQRYVSHVRSVLHLLRVPLGAIADTQRLARGADKITRDVFRREKIRASAGETRQLHKWCSQAGYHLLAASWTIARHFCLRYSELLNLGSSDVQFSFSGEHLKTCVIRFARRKCYNEPCETTRRCICKMQGRTLCGVCALFSLGESSPVPFADVQYSEALAVLKLAAKALQLRSAGAWGTHAFRRGFADEALQNGGPAALFFSGGWKGVAAFGYASAQSRGALAAAEWLVDHSDSSDGEQT